MLFRRLGDLTPMVVNRKRPTIKDIARLAKVTPTTVSMALNNRPRISRQTRERILNIAKKLNYHTDLVAKSLISGRSYTIGLIINNISDPFYPELAEGIIEKAYEYGYNVILCNARNSQLVENNSIEMLRSRGVDGIICAVSLVDDPHIKSLVNDGFPLVLINRTIYDPLLSTKLNSIVLDNYSGGYQIIKHLYRLGHERIAILSGRLKASTAIERTEGARKAMLDHGLKADPKLFLECNFSREQAQHAVEQLLKLKKRPTAIFAQDDNMALGAREAILQKDLKIPEDIALIGFDNIQVSSISGIDLTTVSQKKFEMGALGVKMLVGKIGVKIFPMDSQIVLRDELIIRKSCGFQLTGYIR